MTAQSSPWEFLLSASRSSFELSRLAHVADIRKEMQALISHHVLPQSRHAQDLRLAFVIGITGLFTDLGSPPGRANTPIRETGTSTELLTGFR